MKKVLWGGPLGKLGMFEITPDEPCSNCKGTGKVDKQECFFCGGTGDDDGETCEECGFDTFICACEDDDDSDMYGIDF